MEIIVIVAQAKNRAIGKDNQLLWHLPKDMQFFKSTTEGYAILTGRKNYFSIPEKFRPLKNRTNILLSRNTDLKEEGVVLVGSIEEGIAYAKQRGERKLFVIGGGQVYAQCMELADTLLVTEVDAHLEADTFFPEIDRSQWREVSREIHLKDIRHAYDFDFVRYEKMKN